ncbi:MAG: sigma-70 family RNA polymerase sigma factor [Planctomycetes bacterium]|nr:sigma-70 family RNA polymerase sigma factor [Planctomycetota bacterium]
MLERWHAGDPRCLDDLLKQHLPWLREQIHRQLGDVLRRKGETMDYVQDAMVQFLQYAPRFQVESEASFRALLLRVARNALCNRYDWFTARRRAIAQERPLPATTILNLSGASRSAVTPSHVAMRHESEAWVRLGMELLDPEERNLLVLRQWDDTPFAVIGEQLGITEDAARMRHKRAVVRLSECVWQLRTGRLDKLLAASADAAGEP